MFGRAPTASPSVGCLPPSPSPQARTHERQKADAPSATGSRMRPRAPLRTSPARDADRPNDGRCFLCVSACRRDGVWAFRRRGVMACRSVGVWEFGRAHIPSSILPLVLSSSRPSHTLNAPAPVSSPPLTHSSPLPRLHSPSPFRPLTLSPAPTLSTPAPSTPTPYPVRQILSLMGHVS
jgi:hypothetical protein